MTMKRPIRVNRLVQILAAGRPQHPRELAERLDVSVRTIYRDLADLSEDYNLPFTQDDNGRYGLSEDAALLVPNLTATERAILTLALDNPALRAARDVGAVIDRIREKLNAAGRRPIEETPRALALTGPVRSGDIEEGVLPLLEEAVRGRTPVSFRYRSALRDTQRRIDPYGIFYRMNAWYLVGHCHMRKELRVFRLDRIVDAKPLGGQFHPPDFDFENFLAHSWGVYFGRTVHEVVIHFDAPLAAMLKDSTHHPSQRIVHLGNGDVEYRISLSHLEEIARWIVGFAGAARAVEPPALVALVADKAARAHEAHRRSDPTECASGQGDLPYGLPEGGAPRQPSLIDGDR